MYCCTAVPKYTTIHTSNLPAGSKYNLRIHLCIPCNSDATRVAAKMLWAATEQHTMMNYDNNYSVLTKIYMKLNVCKQKQVSLYNCFEHGQFLSKVHTQYGNQ